MNKAIIMGNLGADPETRSTRGGTTVCNLRVAVNERVKKGDNWEDHTEWFRVVCWGKTAENAAKYLEKGRKVLIEGKFRTKKWTDDNGVDRWSSEISAHSVQFLDKGTGGGGSGGGGSRGSDHYDGGPDDDIPF